LLKVCKSAIYLSTVFGGLILLGVMGLHSQYALSQSEAARSLRGNLVKKLQLTDLCLATEARYTRHPAMADLHSPFQDHPVALEHFPSGGVLAPPVFLTRSRVQVH
jgi:hypothetical protein